MLHNDNGNWSNIFGQFSIRYAEPMIRGRSWSERKALSTGQQQLMKPNDCCCELTYSKTSRRETSYKGETPRKRKIRKNCYNSIQNDSPKKKNILVVNFELFSVYYKLSICKCYYFAGTYCIWILLMFYYNNNYYSSNKYLFHGSKRNDLMVWFKLEM